MKTVADRFARWLDYEHDAHHKVLASFDTVPDERRDDPELQSGLDLLAHIAAARALWLFRMGVAESGPTSAEALFPRGSSREAVTAELDAMYETWRGYLASLSDEDLARVFVYTSHEGERFQNQVEDLLTQLFGHSSYHRGQIASKVRRLGGEPAATDYVFWSQRPAGDTVT